MLIFPREPRVFVKGRRNILQGIMRNITMRNIIVDEDIVCGRGNTTGSFG
jgi:hypothetical protein